MGRIFTHRYPNRAVCCISTYNIVKWQIFPSWLKTVKHLSKAVSNEILHIHLFRVSLWYRMMLWYFPSARNAFKHHVMYVELNEKIERMSKHVYSIFVEASLVGLVMPPLLITLVNYFIYDLSEESYFLPTPVMYVNDHFKHYFVGKKLDEILFCKRMPFDWHTPFGYFMTYLTEFGASVATFLCVASIICFLIGSCWLFIHFAKDIADDLSILNAGEISSNNYKEVMDGFCNIIQSYTDVTGW